MKFILGKKIEMTQMFDEKGNVIPVTLVEAGPCIVTQVKKNEKDKYEAIQVGFEELGKKRISKVNKKSPYRHKKEFRGEIDVSKYNIGDKIDVSIFTENETIQVSGISKGKGFQGGVKRWGFGGKPHTHGAKHEERGMGSVASGVNNRGRITPGKKMPGRMGNERNTIINLKIAKVDLVNNILAIRGAVPGKRGALLEISS